MINLGSISALVIFCPVLEFYNVALACLISAYNSFFLIPLVPIMLEFACELVFPIGEGFVVGCLFACGNLGGFIIGSLTSLIIDGKQKSRSILGICFILILFVISHLLVSQIKE